MKRSIAAAVFAFALIWPANVAATAPLWDLTGEYTFRFDCTAGCEATNMLHPVTITSSDHVTGAVVGSGFWYGDHTVTGTVSGSNVTLAFNWSEAAGPDMTQYNPRIVTGTIDAMGGLSGTATDATGNVMDWSTAVGAAKLITVRTAILTSPASPTNAASLSYTVAFNESVTGLTASDFKVTGTATGCVPGDPVGSGSSYTVALTGCSEGTVIVVLKANSVTDGLNTGPLADATAATVTIDRTAPTASSLAAKPSVGAALSGSSIPLFLSWSARDNAGGSGVARHELGRSTNGATWTTVSTSLVSPSVTVAAVSSGTVRYRVRTIDVAGNVGAWTNGTILSPSLVQETSSSVRYSGTWSRSTSSSYSGGTAMAASIAGRSATYAFTGRSIALVTTNSRTRGKVKLYINGVYQTTVDLYRSSTQYRAIAWQKTWSTSATRTIKVVVVGTSGRPRIDLDAFAVVR